jgi:aryl-alcohol dehydrogenase-like predicted oxidoreductase
MFGYGNYNIHSLASHEEQVAMVKACLQHGINHFDTA